PFDKIGYAEVDTKENRALNQKVAEKCVVLLKNENGLLPLDKKALKTVGVIGPNANNRRALVGNYEGTASRYWTILESIQEYLGDDVRVLASEGCHLCHKKAQGLGQEDDRISEVKAVCANSDVIIACLGLDSGLEGEEGDQGNEYASGDKPNLELPGLQQHVLETICSFGKPVVLVLLSGSALAVNWADQNVPAILQGWYPGAQGGLAIANILFGEKNPEGKLPVTFYKSTDELPEFTDYSMKGRTYRYMQSDALYPFGYGLSYTDFEYSNVDASANADGAVVNATVKNTGKMAGGETMQVYVKVCKDGAPNYQLKGIQKLFLAPGESKDVSIKLPKEALGVFDENGELKIGGKTVIYVGGQAPDARSEKLTGKKVSAFEFMI
ncbi:MAG: glycoside hydrolase family 3 C-terminal domain-containing protein, partial [Lachnospiraceae bacterium]|nr:glycoside hydrolase family 3 C-terminal domain-containing protein [Lachnospiraceae bacterium]